jgi:hypothetical protein
VAQSAIHGLFGPIFDAIGKVKIAHCLENQFTVHDLCDCDRKQHVETEVESLLAIVVEDIRVNIRSCGIRIEIQSLKVGKACGFDGI